jgi:isopenicillin N synthase-like dioxygenase
LVEARIRTSLSTHKESHVTDVSDSRLASKQTAFHEIPIIDIAALVDGSDPEGVARKIGEVCETVGFFYVKNHGVSPDLIARMYAATQQFFRLPAETKQRLHVANSGPTLRGYIPPYGENADPNTTAATSRRSSTSVSPSRRPPRSSART